MQTHYVHVLDLVLPTSFWSWCSSLEDQHKANLEICAAGRFQGHLPFGSFCCQIHERLQDMDDSGFWLMVVLSSTCQGLLRYAAGMALIYSMLAATVACKHSFQSAQSNWCTIILHTSESMHAHMLSPFSGLCINSDAFHHLLVIGV